MQPISQAPFISPLVELIPRSQQAPPSPSHQMDVEPPAHPTSEHQQVESSITTSVRTLPRPIMTSWTRMKVGAYHLLLSIVDGRKSVAQDKEVATLITQDTTSERTDAAWYLLEFACSKKCHLTVLAILSQYKLEDNDVLAVVDEWEFAFQEEWNLHDKGANNALHIACERGYEKLTKRLVNRLGFHRDVKRYDGLKPCVIAERKLSIKRQGRLDWDTFIPLKNAYANICTFLTENKGITKEASGPP